MNVLATFGESGLQWPNYSTLPGRPVLRITFVQYLIAFCTRPDATSDVVSGVAYRPIGVMVHAKFNDSRSNRSRDIRLPQFVTNVDDNDKNAGVRRSSRKGKAFCLKIIIHIQSQHVQTWP